MKRHVFILLMVGLLGVFYSFNQKKKNQRPNILFIMSDDHAYQAISAYRPDLAYTPNMDRIARNGMLFTNASVTNSICSPSRAVILTGKHSHIQGKIDNNFPFDTTNVTFPQILQENGYQTAMFGKLHFGNNPKGFDQYMILPGQGDYYNPDFIIKDQGTQNFKGYVTDLITDFTLDWLKNERKPDKPFFLAYLHKAAHREWLPAERHLEEYLNKTYPEPQTLFDNYEGRGTAAKAAEMNLLKHMDWAGDSKIFPENMDKLGIPETYSYDKGNYNAPVGRMDPDQRAKWDAVYGKMNDEFVRNYPNMSKKDLMKWRYQRYLQDYMGTIAAMDEGIGRVLDYLKETGLDKNTIIVYTSDQGFYMGEHGWYDKRFMYNESFKTPLLIQWNGVIKPGSVSDALVQNLDFAQTFLDAAGIKAPDDMQGQSMIPVLKGKGDNFRDVAYYHYYEYPGYHYVKRHYGIATKKYKLIHFYYDVDEWELYDLEKDPLEMKNVYNDPAYSKIKKEMRQKLAETRKKYKDSEELDQHFIQMYKDAGIIAPGAENRYR